MVPLPKLAALSAAFIALQLVGCAVNPAATDAPAHHAAAAAAASDAKPKPMCEMPARMMNAERPEGRCQGMPMAMQRGAAAASAPLGK